MLLDRKSFNDFYGRGVNPTERRVAEMLFTSTGSHMLDSGGVYGRGWERTRSTFVQAMAWLSDFDDIWTLDRVGIRLNIQDIRYGRGREVDYDKAIRVYSHFFDTDENTLKVVYYRMQSAVHFKIEPPFDGYTEETEPEEEYEDRIEGAVNYNKFLNRFRRRRAIPDVYPTEWLETKKEYRERVALLVRDNFEIAKKMFNWQQREGAENNLSQSELTDMIVNRHEFNISRHLYEEIPPREVAGVTEDWYMTYTRNVYHFLTERLVYQKELDDILDALFVAYGDGKSDFEEYERDALRWYLENGKEIPDDLLDKIQDYVHWTGELGSLLKELQDRELIEFTGHHGGNTCNGESDLSEVLQFSVFSIDSCDGLKCLEPWWDEYILFLQIHRGCDVRGGYTRGSCFTDNGMHGDLEEGYFRYWPDGYLWSESPADGYHHNFRTDDGYHWYEDGGIGAGQQLEQYPITDRIEFIGDGEHIYVSPITGKAYDPITGGELRAW